MSGSPTLSLRLARPSGGYWDRGDHERDGSVDHFGSGRPASSWPGRPGGSIGSRPSATVDWPGVDGRITI